MRRWLLPAIVAILFAASAEGAQACSPPPTYVRVQCGGARIVTNSTLSIPPGTNVFAPIRAACPEQAAALMAVLEREISDWYSKDYRYSLAGGTEVIFEPFTPERERTLRGEQAALLNCNVPAWSRVGDWLKIWRAGREYCLSPLSSALLSAPCGSGKPQLSPTLFIGYIVSHPSRAALPFLIALLIAVGLVVGVVNAKVRAGELLAFIRPSMGKTILPLMIGAMACCAGSPLDLLLFVGVAYFLVSLFPVWNVAREGLLAP